MNKKDFIKYIIEEYDVNSPKDITDELKDLLGGTLQEMMDADFDNHMSYEKHDQKGDKIITAMVIQVKL